MTTWHTRHFTQFSNATVDELQDGAWRGMAAAAGETLWDGFLVFNMCANC